MENRVQKGAERVWVELIRLRATEEEVAVCARALQGALEGREKEDTVDTVQLFLHAEVSNDLLLLLHHRVPVGQRPSAVLGDAMTAELRLYGSVSRSSWIQADDETKTR